MSFAVLLLLVLAAGGLAGFGVFHYLETHRGGGAGPAQRTAEPGQELADRTAKHSEPGRDHDEQVKILQAGSVPDAKGGERKSPQAAEGTPEAGPLEEAVSRPEQSKVAPPVREKPKVVPRVNPDSPAAPRKEVPPVPRKEEPKATAPRQEPSPKDPPKKDPPKFVAKEEPKAKATQPGRKPARPVTLDPGLSEPAREELVIKRRNELSAEVLRKQLLLVPDVGLDQTATALMYAPLRELEKKGESPSALAPDYGPRFLAGLAKTKRRPELTFFPWRKGPDCQLGKEAAERLHVLSSNLRTCLRAATPEGDIRPDPDKLRALLLKGTDSGGASLRGLNSAEIKPSEWREPGAVPALVQMLQAENTPIRLLLVELLSQITGKEAGSALAQRALFDLSPDVREKAVRALADRPAGEYRELLVEAFRHPWPAVADHAAEALVALKDQGAVPALIDLLPEPDPKLPVPVKERGKELLAVREFVRISHLSNCMLCHAPSLSKEDLVRGRVPLPGEEAPPLYSGDATGIFVRADTTYLRQDFSVVQPVANSGKWPGNQRFDYLVRTRPLSKAEVTRYKKWQKENPKPGTCEQREAVLYTLKELTGKNPGSTYEDWEPFRKARGSKEGPPGKGD